jgi:hypothetical protein
VPSESLYTYEEYTQTYQPVEEPSPYESYYTYDLYTGAYNTYIPTPVESSNGPALCAAN